MPGEHAPLPERSVHYLKKLLAQTLKLPPEQIDAQAALEHYGIDSILALQMVNALEPVFGPLSKTLLFEYESIAALSGYFLANHRVQLEELLSGEAPGAGRAVAAEPVVVSAAPASTARRRGRRRRAPEPEGAARVTALDIAIVGMSGRYPQALDLQAYWRNLRDGVDCISEIPAERWDHACTTTTQGPAGQDVQQVGRVHRGSGRIRSAVLQHLAARGAGDGPAGAAVPSVRVRDAGGRGVHREALAPRQDEEAFAGRVGVFVGVMWSEYQLYGAQSQAMAAAYALSGSLRRRSPTGCRTSATSRDQAWRWTRCARRR